MPYASPTWWSRQRYAYKHVLGACPNLQWLHSGGVGADDPLYNDLIARGARVTTSSGANASIIAHTAILHVLAHARRLDAWRAAQARHSWEPHDVDDLSGQVLGVLGLGPIGLSVATVGASLGMRVIGLRRTPRGDEPCEVWPLDRIDDARASRRLPRRGAPVDRADASIARRRTHRRPQALGVHRQRRTRRDRRRIGAGRGAAAGQPRGRRARRVRRRATSGRQPVLGPAERRGHATLVRAEPREGTASDGDVRREPRSVRAGRGPGQRGGQRRAGCDGG